MWSKNAVFHKTRILRVFLIRQTGSFPLKGEQSRNMSVPSPHQQTFFVSVLLFFLSPKCVEKYVWVCSVSPFSQLALWDSVLVFVPSQAFKRVGLILWVLLWGMRSRSSMEFIKLGVYSGSPLRDWWQWRSLSCVWGQHLCSAALARVCCWQFAYIYPMYLVRVFHLGGYFFFFLNFVQTKWESGCSQQVYWAKLCSKLMSVFGSILLPPQLTQPGMFEKN